MIFCGAAQSIPADNNWYHVAIVANRTADTLEIYINGSVSGGTHDISSITGSLDNAASFRIFNSNGTDQFAGELDQVVAELSSDGISTRTLKVSQAFHSPLIEPSRKN